MRSFFFSHPLLLGINFSAMTIIKLKNRKNEPKVNTNIKARFQKIINY